MDRVSRMDGFDLYSSVEELLKKAISQKQFVTDRVASRLLKRRRVIDRRTNLDGEFRTSGVWQQVLDVVRNRQG